MSYVRKEIQYRCGHTRWYSSNHPKPDTQVFCFLCDAYVLVGAPEALGVTYEAAYEWTSQKVGKVTVGRCQVKGCGYEREEYRWHKLSALMERHYLMNHIYSSLLDSLAEVPIPTRLPPGSPPPF